jgi:hypothetical protein
MAGFWAMTGLCLLASYPSGKKVDHRIEAIALSGLFFLASLMACRFALFWGLISIPVFAALIESVKSQKIWNWKQIDLNKNKQAGLLCFLAFVCVLVLTIVGFLSPVENRTFPTRCIQDLRQNLGISRVYNYREWGGIITFAGSDHWQIGLDGRLYLYSEDDFQNYAKEALGLVSVDAIEERHQPDAFFLRRDFHSALIDLLISDASWDVSCKDGLGVVFTRSRD